MTLSIFRTSASIALCLTLIYQSAETSPVVKFDMLTRYDPCQPMGNPHLIPDQYPEMVKRKLPFRVHVDPSEDNRSQMVNIVGNLFKKVFVEARTSPSAWAPLVGKWSSQGASSGQKVMECEDKPQSAVASGSNDSPKWYTSFTWRGTCTQGVTFFIYVSFDEVKWLHVSVPCQNYTQARQADAQSVEAIVFSPWSKFGRCSKTCGEATQTRIRKCLLEIGCVGSTKETRNCTLPSCSTYECKDLNFRCPVWESVGLCSGNFASWVRTNCPLSCGVCSQPSKPCRDSIKYRWSCSQWAAKNRCTAQGFYRSFIRENCPESCGIC